MFLNRIVHAHRWLLLIAASLLLIAALPAPPRTSAQGPRASAPAPRSLPGRLSLVGSTIFADDHPANGVAIQGRYAYVAYGDARFEGYGLRIVDLQNPASPAIVGGVNLRPPGQTGQINAVAVAGAHAYLAAGSEGLQVIDVANPAAPAVAGAYAPQPAVYAWDVALGGGHAYLGVGDRIIALNLANPASPQFAGQLAAPARTLYLSGTTLYAGNQNTLAVIDVANPAAPALRGTATLPGMEAVADIAANGATVYVGHGYCFRGCSGGVTAVDAANPAAPAVIHTHWLDRNVTALANDGALVFASTDNGCDGSAGLCSGVLRALDMAAPQNPQQLAIYSDLGAGASGVAVAGGLIAVTDNDPSYYSGDGVLRLLRYGEPLPLSVFLPLVGGR